MLEGLDELCDVIYRNRELAEDTARLAPEVLTAAGEVGLWTLAAPADCGGLELPFPEIISLFEDLAEADSTVAWHAVNSTSMGALAARLDPKLAKEIIGDEPAPFGYAGAVMAGVRATQTDVGYRVDGRWPFMTGSADARWAAVLAPVHTSDGAPAKPVEIRMFALKMSELAVDLTWDVASGMRGTGSHAVTAEAVTVPAERTAKIVDPAIAAGPLFRTSPRFVFLGPCAAMAIGMLRSSIAGVVEFCAGKMSRFDGHAHDQDARVLQTLTDATAAADTLSIGLAALSDDIWDCYVSGREPGDELRARFWSAVFYTLDSTRCHISDLYAVGSSKAYATRNPVDRALRDIHAVNAAFDSFQSLRRAAGSVLFGHETNHPMF